MVAAVCFYFSLFHSLCLLLALVVVLCLFSVPLYISVKLNIFAS